jgi:hypothetical protein
VPEALEEQGAEWQQATVGMYTPTHRDPGPARPCWDHRGVKLQDHSVIYFSVTQWFSQAYQVLHLLHVHFLASLTTSGSIFSSYLVILNTSLVVVDCFVFLR